MVLLSWLCLQAVVVDEDKMESSLGKDVCGMLLQYPATDGTVNSYKVRLWLAVCASEYVNVLMFVRCLRETESAELCPGQAKQPLACEAQVKTSA